MKHITTALITILVCAGTTLYAEPEIKGTASELAQYLKEIPRTVTLTGESEVKMAADRAIVSIRVVTENKTLQEASRLNQELRTKMIRTLAEKSLPADRIHASRFSSTPKYGVFSEKAKSYRVENVVKITTHDEKEFQSVASLVDTTPEFRHDGIEFEHSDKQALKRRAMEQALDKVMEKKKLYEEKLGVKLTPKSFDEGRVMIPNQAGPRNKYYATAKSIAPISPLDSNYQNRAADAAGDEEATTSFDELVFKAVVTVEYAVESR